MTKSCRRHWICYDGKGPTTGKVEAEPATFDEVYLFHEMSAPS